MNLRSTNPVSNECSHQNAHFVGACGAGMKALAELLLDAGWSISGSDLLPLNGSIQKLVDRGFVFFQGHHVANLSDSAQCLVYSSAIPETNVERIEGKRRQLPEFTYSQMVGRLMSQSTGVCIAGTHGKSTTTAMTACILDSGKRLSGVVVGAELCQGGKSGWGGPGDLFVVESCEFQQSFFEYRPKYSAILSVEPDHFDCYSDAESLESAFCDFAGKTANDGVLLVNHDCPASRSVSSKAVTEAKRVSFGLNNSADWSATSIDATKTGMRFTILNHGRHFSDIELILHGNHNVQNALAAAALCAEIGVSPEIIRTSLAKFQGIRRRFEFVGEWNGATLVDDYAHHPTAVKATLETLRKVAGDRRIVCVFQPHQISRTLALMAEFSESFGHADEVMLAPVFAARESVTDEPVRVSQELGNRLSSGGISTRTFASLDQIVSALDDAVRLGDVIVTMGAGDIDRIHHELTRRI